MSRPQMFTRDIESSDSEREDYDRATLKRDGYRIRSSSKTSARRIRRSPKDTGRSWRSSLLKWNVLQIEDAEEVLPSREERSFDKTLAYNPSTERAGSRSESELPLSDPKSWVWQRKKDAKLAVAIDTTNGIFLDVSRPRELVSKDVDLANGASYLACEKSETKMWLDRVEIPLLLAKKSDFALSGSLKQTSINNFFGHRAPMAKRKAKPAAIRLNKGPRAVTGLTPGDGSPDLHESASPSAPEDEASSNKGRRGISKSTTSTPPTSAVNTPEPTANEAGRVRLSRTAKKELPAALVASASEVDASSVSDFLASENQSDAVTDSQSATDCLETEESTEEEDDHVILPAAKRIRLNNNKSALASPSPEDLVEEDDSENSTTDARAKKSGKKKTDNDSQYIDTFTYKVGINENLKPICKIEDIFGDITANARKLGLDKAIHHLQGRKLRIATMCSGTESPLLAIQLVSDNLKRQGEKLEYEHLFSAEIVPFKQAYIERNFAPSIIYRDIKELSIPGAVYATTAYGGRAKIPGGLDLLIAGFSCVDFSNLNNEKKTLKAGGESGDTFYAIKDYAAKYRPKIMILENVDGAPWQAIRDTAWADIGYVAEFYKVDTKDYYIPQTRCRGYMICVDAREYHDPNGKHHKLMDSKTTKSMLSTWTSTLEAFERPASCPVEAFLLAEDDPRIIRGRAELANSGRGDRRIKAVDWARCRGRHQDYRADLNLGQKRPLTKWEDGGSCKPSDYMWQDWMRGQVERIWDTVEVSWLRNLNRGFDHQYKCRLLELSQNVDRVKDNSGSGIVGCITPTGIPFSTIRGGPLIGLEALSLQGLPIDKLQLTRERQSQLQDLAGNAMSSTVVGPAVLAALIAGYKILPPVSPTAMDTYSPPSLSRHYGENRLVQFYLDLTDYEPASVPTVLDIATKTIRLCLCEGREMVTVTALQQCSLCKHTTCIKCGGNPSHKYAPLKQEIISQRLPPATFGDFIKKTLPMKLTFLNLSEAALQELKQEHGNNIESQSWKVTIGVVRKAFASVLHFRAVRRSELWTIYYDSEYASLQLIISHDRAEWRLYAKPSSEQPVNSDIRKLLSRPIARMQPTGADIVKGSWQFWLPKVYKFDVTIRGGGSLTRSFENIQGIGKFADTEVWEDYSILVPNEASRRLDVDINGTYKLLQDCGAALGSLHIQVKSAKSCTPLFLFFDPDRIHHPDKDNFVFSLDKRRLDYGERRSVIARVDSSWRPPKLEKARDSCADGDAKYRINGSKNLVTLAEAQLPTKVQCAVDGQWVDLPNLEFDTSKDRAASFHRAPPTFTIVPSVNSCQVAHIVLSCVATLPKDEQSPWQTNDWIEIPLTQHKEFFTAFAWLIQKASNIPGLENWKEVNSPPSNPCQMCAPDAPGIKWRLEGPKSTKQEVNPTQRVAVNKNQPSKLVAFEDLGQAATFERLLKNRPSPLVTQIHINENGLIQLKIAVNPETLMHRALAKLLLTYEGAGMSMSWRLCTNQASLPNASLPTFTLKNNNNDSPAGKPPGFLYGLRPEQSRSLAWMIRQENGESEPFIEEEVEEAGIPQIGWLAEGRARKPVFVRGGVLADEVGYGKTVTTLALIDIQRSRDREIAKIPVEGRIPIQATLILVPHQLPDQWHHEIKKFLHKNRAYNVLIIKTMLALQKLTIAEFQSADIIIVSWSLCEGDSYLFSVAQFAGMVELTEKPANRPAAVWYKQALREIRTHVVELQGGGRGLQEMIAQKLEVSKTKAAAEETFIPSKRLRGQAYQKAKRGPAVGSKRTNETAFINDSGNARNDRMTMDNRVQTEALKPRSDVFGLGKIAAGKISWKAMKCPLLELFEFSRMVIDEYTYITGQESLTIPNLKAKSRWILSATPPLRDFADVKCISGFLGVNLGIDDLTPGVIKAGNIKALEKDRTDCELFQSFNLSHSASWHQRRHGVAQRFLDQFVRQNVADIEAIKGSTHMRPIVLPAAERAIYIELNQLLAGNDFDLKKCKVNADNDRARRIREILGDSESAGEALMKCASHFTLGDLDIKFRNAPEACEVIAKLRQSQYDALKVHFAKKLKQAEWLKNECSIDVRQYSSWKEQVNSNQNGDSDSTEEIKSMIKAAEFGYDEKHWVEFYVSRRLKPEGIDPHRNMERAALALRDVTNELRKLSVELVIRRRCLRFFECARSLQKTYTSIRENESLTAGCSCEKCGKANLSPDKVSIFSLCGHTVCNSCLDISKDRDDQCLVTGCDAVNKAYQVIQAAELGVEDDTTRVGRHYGKKLEDIMRLIKTIPKDDQVLLFVQFADLMDIITSALEENNITYSSLSGLGKKDEAAKILTEFQTNMTTATKKKVLILTIGDASAAGSNLTNANHVIFVSPFFTESKQTYDHAMTQAIGRTRRYGQTKPVHIYQFLSLKTVDVDTLQQHSRKILAENVAPPPEFVPYDTFVPSGFGLINGVDGDKGRFGSAETSEALMGNEDA